MINPSLKESIRKGDLGQPIPKASSTHQMDGIWLGCTDAGGNSRSFPRLSSKSLSMIFLGCV